MPQEEGPTPWDSSHQRNPTDPPFDDIGDPSPLPVAESHSRMMMMMMLPQQSLQQQQQPQPQPQPRSRPIAIIRRKSSDFLDDNEDDSSGSENDNNVTSSNAAPPPFRRPRHHQSMPTDLFLRAPLLSSIPTRYDQEELIPEFQLSDEPPRSGEYPNENNNNSSSNNRNNDSNKKKTNRTSTFETNTTTISSQPKAYGSLRESQMQQRFLVDNGSVGKPHSFIRKRGGGTISNNYNNNSNNTSFIHGNNNNNNNNDCNTISASAPIRTSMTSMASGLTIGERIQQQRKFQMAFTSKNINNSSNNNNSNKNSTAGWMDQSGNSSMSSLLSVTPSNADVTKPKRTSSILAAMLDQQQQPPSSLDDSRRNDTSNKNSTPAIPNFIDYDNHPSVSNQHNEILHRPTTTTTDSTNSSSTVLSSSWTGLEILQQHRRPWIGLSKHRSLPPTKPTDMTTSSSSTSTFALLSPTSAPLQDQPPVAPSSSAYASVFHHPNHTTDPSYSTEAVPHPLPYNTRNVANFNGPTDSVVDVDPTNGRFLLPPTAHIHTSTTNLNATITTLMGGGSSSSSSLHHHPSHLQPDMEVTTELEDDLMDENSQEEEDDLVEAFDLDME